MSEACGCRWTPDNGATRESIGDALPGLDPCAGHMAAIQRAYRNGWDNALSLAAARDARPLEGPLSPDLVTMPAILRRPR